jgi:hypothetical protein
MSMLDITGNDVALLNDEDLRALVARLCEAELRRLGLSTAAVTWGGSQTAPDGGLDVRVALPPGTEINGWLPRTTVGLQVKAENMTAGKIAKEMRPAGNVRPVICALADEGGAYIIVSSKGSTSDSALRDRRRAMAEALNGFAKRDALALDFYDRTRMATWLRDHPGLIPWTRARIGKALQGWHSYGPWAYPPEGAEAEYLVDETLRIHTGRREDGQGLGALEGIARLRAMLREPRRVVRIVGLSGVGKTRLVQALFDGRDGAGALDPSLAVYTNMQDDPQPQPGVMATDLISAQMRALVIVDNCPSDLHRRLSEVSRSPGSTIGLITIEYDIRDDQPEGTEVVTIEPSSPDLIEKLLKRRFPDLSPVDAGTIAAFSGGNARIAIALAATVEKNETVAGLNDEELFQRLFLQRHGDDGALLHAAQVCSLVYSFQGEDLTGEQAELPRLAKLIGQDAQALYGSVADLEARDLVQRRGAWRAVLPHAVANRLAETALARIPLSAITGQLVNGAPVRLFRSFSRRLGYLHKSQRAVEIVKGWVSPGGVLADVAGLDEEDRDIFANIAPAAPEAVLAALNRAAQPDAGAAALGKSRTIVHLVRSLAYETALFDRAARLLIRLALESGNDRKHRDAREAFESLFFLRLCDAFVYSPVCLDLPLG